MYKDPKYTPPPPSQVLHFIKTKGTTTTFFPLDKAYVTRAPFYFIYTVPKYCTLIMVSVENVIRVSDK